MRRGLAIWQVVVLSERALKPRVERGGINENNNNNGFSFIVASPLEVRANFHNFTARLRSFARSPATQASNPDIVRPSLALTMRCVIGDLLVNTEPIVCVAPGDVFTPDILYLG